MHAALWSQLSVSLWFKWKQVSVFGGRNRGPLEKDLSEVGDEPEGNWFH